MIERSIVEEVLVLWRLGRSLHQISKELRLARNTVRRYVRGAEAGVQKRPRAARMDEALQERARTLFREEADGNAVVIRDLLEEEGLALNLRTVQRCVEPVRQQLRAAELATGRFETPPGEQMQIDFGERRVVIGGQQMTVYFFVATLGFSRRIYVRASLSQRQDEWKLGLDGAMERFGGRPEVVVVDNARALILEHTSEHKVVHPAFAAFCKDRGLAVFACRPYRARTKGKVESGVKYVKRNAIARRRFESFRAMEEHLERWMAKADQRQHGTTHRRPIDLFVEKEAAALRPLRAALPAATQRLRRMVANDCYVDIDTVRYSVPHRLARATVEVTQSDEAVRIWKGSELVAEHRRSHEPYARVTDPSHFVGLHTPSAAISELAAAGAEAVNPLAAFGRSLSDYHQIIGGAP